MNALEMLSGIELVIDPTFTDKGLMKWRRGPGIRLALVFHDVADKSVWLEQMREQGLRG